MHYRRGTWTRNLGVFSKRACPVASLPTKRSRMFYQYKQTLCNVNDSSIYNLPWNVNTYLQGSKSVSEIQIIFWLPKHPLIHISDFRLESPNHAKTSKYFLKNPTVFLHADKWIFWIFPVHKGYMQAFE